MPLPTSPHSPRRILVHALVRDLLTHFRGRFCAAEEFRRGTAIACTGAFTWRLGGVKQSISQEPIESLEHQKRNLLSPHQMYFMDTAQNLVLQVGTTIHMAPVWRRRLPALKAFTGKPLHLAAVKRATFCEQKNINPIERKQIESNLFYDFEQCGYPFVASWWQFVAFSCSAESSPLIQIDLPASKAHTNNIELPPPVAFMLSNPVALVASNYAEKRKITHEHLGDVGFPSCR